MTERAEPAYKCGYAFTLVPMLEAALRREYGSVEALVAIGIERGRAEEIISGGKPAPQEVAR